MRETQVARELLAVFAMNPATPMAVGEIRYKVAEAVGTYVSHQQLRSMLDQLVRGRVVSYTRNARGHRLYQTYDHELPCGD